MAEWSIAAVLKTVEGHTSGGSNPSLSAKGGAVCSTQAAPPFQLIPHPKTQARKPGHIAPECMGPRSRGTPQTKSYQPLRREISRQGGQIV